ncbi:MAG TPA: Crp/Fnr family transcriptional regulator [Miltoncostaea sp.]|nr:Crp/Fnr family transcriptional regulator [Miltoncostaea sp.]
MSSTASPNDFAIFRQVDDVERHAAGEVIFAEGEVAEVAYVVRTGEVAISVGGRELERLGEGAMFGEMAIIESEPRSATATAATDVELAVVDRRTFRRLVTDTPFFAENVMRVMAARLRRANSV